MTIEEFFKRVKEGDVDAMISFGDMCIADEFDPDTIKEALIWYERAAELGSMQGAIRVVNLRKIRGILCEELNDFKGAVKEYNMAVFWAGKILKMQDVPANVMLSAKEEYGNNQYRVACSYYFAEEYLAARMYVESIENTNFNTVLLRGVCEYDLAKEEADWNRAYLYLNSIEEQLLSYKFSKQPGIREQILLVKGYIFLSQMYGFGTGGAVKDLVRAKNILIAANRTIMDDGLKEDIIAKELERYC